jgi:2-keto-3-deoxy-L-rhamnonate aldolase RhmA
MRSVAGAGALQRYQPTPLGEINTQGNAATLLIAMLETPEGVENAEAMATVPGIDVLLIGSNDLCTAMGIPGETRHPKLRAAYETVASACRRHGKQLGVGGIRSDPAHLAELIALGARFVIAGSDVQYLLSAARNDLAAVRKGARLPE